MFRRVSKGNPTARDTATDNSNRGRFRGRGGAFTRRPGRPKLTGVFADGIWHCDCDPRLPAEHFKVKKEGPNKGRWFYTCQNGEGRRCGFFLWDDDAKPREEAAVLSNSRNEPRSTPGVFPSRREEKPSSQVQQSPDTTQSSLNTASTPSQPRTISNKRTFADTGLETDSEDDPFPWPLTGQEETELAQIDTPETPRKTVKLCTFETPATSAHRKLPWLGYPLGDGRVSSPAAETPSKPTALMQLPTPSQSKPRDATTQITPSPSRFRDALAETSPHQSNFAAEVFSLFNASNVTLPAKLMSELGDMLNSHELRTQGVIKGRDITRLALKARDAKVVELEARIASLEADQEVDRARIETLKWEQSIISAGLNPDTKLQSDD